MTPAAQQAIVGINQQIKQLFKHILRQARSLPLDISFSEAKIDTFGVSGK
jgi:hypothetical protein